MKYKIKNELGQYVMGNEQLDLWGWTNAHDNDELAFIFSEEKAKEMIKNTQSFYPEIELFLEEI